MRVGLGRAIFELASVRYATQSLVALLATRHELCYLPPDFDHATWSDQQRAAETLVGSCDVLVGFVSDPTVALLLAARNRTGRTTPLILFVLGAFPRGGGGIRQIAGDLNTADVLVVNCTADADLARRFYSNARIVIVPFITDGGVYSLMPEEERLEIRRAMGFDPTTRVVLYVGRITPEKNVHLLIRVFAMVQHSCPQSRLVLAGSPLDVPFLECGVVPIGFARTIANVVAAMRLPAGSVQFVGSISQEKLRNLYSAADVLLNLTLNHDENFGFAQAEAFACGTPAVGTAWGGLKDSIVEGQNGFVVSAEVTPLGVKVSWWEAVNRTLGLLTASDSLFRRKLVHRSSKRYSREEGDARMQSLLGEAAGTRRTGKVRLRPTTFARQFWKECLADGAPVPRYEQRQPSFALYQRLIKSYAATTPVSVGLDASFEENQIITLATPVRLGDGNVVEVDDPLYPFEITLPRQRRQQISALLAALCAQPAISVASLSEASGIPAREQEAALHWMQASGLILRSSPNAGWLDPRAIDARMSQPLFNRQRVDVGSTDFLVF